MKKKTRRAPVGLFSFIPSRWLRWTVFFVIFIILPLALSAQSAYIPGAALKENLGRADIGGLMAAGTYFLTGAFMVEIIYRIYLMMMGMASINSIFMPLGKYFMLGVLYLYGGELVTEVSNLVLSSTTKSEEIEKTFYAFDNSLMKLMKGPGTPKVNMKESYNNNMDNLPDGAAGNVARKNADYVQDGSGGQTSSTDAFSLIQAITSPPYLIGFLTAFILKILLILSLATKHLLLDIVWPIVHQLVLLGFIFAVPFAAFSGWEPVKRFGITIVEVSAWPLIYNIGYGIGAKFARGTFDEFIGILAGTEKYETLVGTMSASLDDLAKLAAYFIFLIMLGSLTPAIAAMVVRSESGAAIAQALQSRVTAMVMSRGGGSMSINIASNNSSSTVNNNTESKAGDKE